MKITHKKLVSATESIECDALNPIANMVKRLSKSLWSNLKRLITEGITVEKSEEGKNGTFYLRAKTKNGNRFLVKCMPVPHNQNNFDLFFLTEDRPEPENRQDVPKNDIAEVIGEWAYERFDEEDYKLDELVDDDTGESQLESSEAETQPSSEEQTEPEVE